MSEITEEYLEGLRALHGRVKHLQFNGVDLIFRKPKRLEIKQHMQKREDPATKVDADEQLAQQLVIRCGESEGMAAKQAFLQLLEDYPYLVNEQHVMTAIAKLAGLVQDEEVKTSRSASSGSGAPRTSTPQASASGS